MIYKSFTSFSFISRRIRNFSLLIIISQPTELITICRVMRANLHAFILVSFAITFTLPPRAMALREAEVPAGPARQAGRARETCLRNSKV